MPGTKTMQVKATEAKKKKPRVSNQVTLDAENPIPIGSGNNVFSFVHQAAYIPFLAGTDNFGQMLLEARLLSVTHNACVSTKKDYCAGEGFFDIKGKELSENIQTWFKAMNLKNESATKINKKIFEAKFTWGNVPIEIVRITAGGQKKLFVYVHNFLEWRLGKPNDDDVVEYAVQSRLFVKTNGYVTSDILKKSKRLPIYNPMNSEKDNWGKDEQGVERTMIWYRNDVTGFAHYGMPSAVSSMIYQILEYKGARFNLDNFDNNMVVAAILALKGQLGQEEANRIGKKIISTYTGDGKRGRTVVVASEEGIEGSDLHKMDTKTDGSFNESDTVWTQKVILANQWDAILAGIVAPSTMGKGANFITKLHELKLKTVIIPEQKDVIDEVWSIIFKIADEWLGLGIKEYDLGIKNTIDISGLTDVDITPAVTVDEVREAKGLPELEGGKGKILLGAKKEEQKNKGGDDVQD